MTQRLGEMSAAPFGELADTGWLRRFAMLRARWAVASASAGAFAVLVTGAGLSYATQLVIARTIGADSFGIYAYVLAWVTLAAYMSTLGFHTSLLRLLPAYQARSEWPLARGVAVCAYVVAAGLGSGIAIAMFAAASLLVGAQYEMVHTFWIGVLTIPLIALQLVASAGARAFGGPVIALVPERILRDGATLVIVAAAGWSQLWRPDATLAMAAMLAGCLVALATAHSAFRRLRPASFGRDRAATALRDWFRPSIPLTVIMAADNIMCRSGVLALGLTGNIRDAGVFAVAFSIALLTTLPRMAVASIFAPTVSSLHAAGDDAGLRKLSAHATVLSLLGTLLVAIPLVGLASPLLSWFGANFTTGVPVVAILVAGQLVAAAAGPQQHLLTMTGHERAAAAIFLASAVGNFAACVVMIDLLGMVGAALAMTAATVAFNVAAAVAVARYLKLEPGLVIAIGNMAKSRPNHAQGPAEKDDAA